MYWIGFGFDLGFLLYYNYNVMPILGVKDRGEGLCLIVYSQ
jgi:hypothetical protein